MSTTTILTIFITIFLTNSVIVAGEGFTGLPSLGPERIAKGTVVRGRVVALPLLSITGRGIVECEDDRLVVPPTPRGVPRALRAKLRAGEGKRDHVRLAFSGPELANLLAQSAERCYREGERDKACALYVQAAEEIVKKIPKIANKSLYAERASRYYCAAAGIAFYYAEEETIIDLYTRAMCYAELASQRDPHKYAIRAIAYPLHRSMIRARHSGLGCLAEALESLLTPKTVASALMMISITDLLSVPPSA